MLKIRLQRVGRKNNPSYRVVVVDSRNAAKKGKPVEFLGSHDTIQKSVSLKKERIQYWISKGAQVSDTVHNLLIQNGIIVGVKINNLPKKSPIVTEKKEEDTKDNVKTTEIKAEIKTEIKEEIKTDEKLQKEPNQKESEQEKTEIKTEIKEEIKTDKKLQKEPNQKESEQEKVEVNNSSKEKIFTEHKPKEIPEKRE